MPLSVASPLRLFFLHREISSTNGKQIQNYALCSLKGKWTCPIDNDGQIHLSKKEPGQIDLLSFRTYQWNESSGSGIPILANPLLQLVSFLIFFIIISSIKTDKVLEKNAERIHALYM